MKYLSKTSIDIYNYLKSLEENGIEYEDISNNEISREIGKARKTIITSLKSLQELGYIELEYIVPTYRKIKILK